MSVGEQQPGARTVVRTVGRRGLFAGAAGAAGLAAAGGPAAASQGSGARGGDDGSRAQKSPITTSIASPELPGVVYAVVDMYDFTPFWPDSRRSWNGYGTHCVGTAGPLRASVDIPAGALLYDVEYYISNNSGSPSSPFTALYTPGSGTITVLGGQPSVPSSTAGVLAYRSEINADNNGPYPPGSKILVNVDTPVNGTVQVNGVRVGFTYPPAPPVTPAPPPTPDHGELRLSAATGTVLKAKLAKKKPVTITLPAGLVPAGATGVQLHLMADKARRAGVVRAYAAGAPAPAAAQLGFAARQASATAVIVPVSAGRQITVSADQKVRLTVDVAGYVT